MFSLNDSMCYYLSTDCIDMRKGINSLIGVVKDRMGREVVNGDIFIFIGRSRKLMKLIHAEDGGMAMYVKRLESGYDMFLHTLSTPESPFMWYPKLFTNSEFKAKVKERWAEVYPTLSQINAKIVEYGAENAVSDSYNQAMWPVELANQTVTWYEYCGDERMTYEEAIENLVNVITSRAKGMDTEINDL